MPNPAKMQFFKENKECRDLIDKENVRRTKRNLALLTDQEIDDAVGEMMALAKEGQRIRTFKFPDLPATPPVQAQPSIPITKKHKDSFQFEAVVCANGFLLNMNRSGKQESFIFKTEEDLMSIFKQTVFIALQTMEKEPEHG